MVEFIYQFFELFATFIEGVLAIFVSTSLAGRKLSIKQNILYGLSMSIIYTILITLLNKWQVFFFYHNSNCHCLYFCCNIFHNKR